jgi:hypothetical protein
MNQGKAKAFLAIIIALVVMLAAYVMFFNNAMPETGGATLFTPSPQPPTPEPEPDNHNSGTGAVSGHHSSGSSGGGGGDGSQEELPETPHTLVASYDGYWGGINTPEPISSFNADIYAYAATASGELIDLWMEISGSYQGQAIYIKFPIAQTSFEGYISFQPDYSQKQTITGSFWKESQNPGAFISFFSWESNNPEEGTDYWIYSNIQTDVPPSGSNAWFAGYWGTVPTPIPIGGLKGVVLSVGTSQTGNVAYPWLHMTGPYPGSNVTIRFPLSQENFAEYEGYIMFLQNAADIKSMLITGSYWCTPGGTGSLFSFFTWQGTSYWIFGQCYDL